MNQVHDQRLQHLFDTLEHDFITSTALNSYADTAEWVDVEHHLFLLKARNKMKEVASKFPALEEHIPHMAVLMADINRYVMTGKMENE